MNKITSIKSSDSNSSYQSDDSDVNYITGYAIEDAEQCLNSSKRHSDHEHDDYPGLPYSEEPLADEEWTRSYQTSENARREFEEKLRKRFDGSVGISEW